MTAGDQGFERRIADSDREIQELRGQVKLLEEELELSRRRLDSAPKQIATLEKQLAQTDAELAGARVNSQRLADVLKEAREQLTQLKDEVERLTQPPASYGVFLQRVDENTVDVFTNGRKLRVNVAGENVLVDDLQRGQEVILNEALNV